MIVEIAQNAADAAARSGVAGRLLLRLRMSGPEGAEFVAANTGEPLDAAGVESASTLRASAKRNGPGTSGSMTGRFGVGFSAVLAVSDCPALVSRTGGVEWSRQRTTDEVLSIPVLHSELDRRAGHVPVLRLPWPSERPPEPEYDSTVVLPLRDDDAVGQIRAALETVDAALLLMLPALAEIVVDAGDGVRVFRSADLEVRTVSAVGLLAAGLLDGLPTEDRESPAWSVRWAAPRPPNVAPVLHAPTPTDEPIDLPAVLIGSFPLDPTRRHIAPGPVADFLIAQAATLYVELVETQSQNKNNRPANSQTDARAAADAVLRLIPGPVASGQLDADLRRACLDLLRRAPFLPGSLAPSDAVSADGMPAPAWPFLAEALPELLPPGWSGRRELDVLGVRRIGLADAIDELAQISRPAAWWRDCYAALEGAPLEALTGLPVPLADGRVVRGARSLIVGSPDDRAPALAMLGLRVVDPAADHPLLGRLGAGSADAAVLLDEPAVRAAVLSSLDAEDPAPIAQAVLALVEEAAVRPGEQSWLEELALPDDTGEWAGAGELLLPGGRLRDVLDPEALATVDAAWVDRWGQSVLAAVGVLDSFSLVDQADIVVDPAGPDWSEIDLAGQEDWLAEVLDSVGSSDGAVAPIAARLLAIRDLELVSPDRWAQALLLIADDRRLRAAVVEPMRVTLADGTWAQVEPYTAWWIRTHPVFGGRRPGELRSAGTSGMLGELLDEVPDDGLDAEFLHAIGVVDDVSAIANSPMELPLVRAGVRGDSRSGREPDGSGATLPVPQVARRVLPSAAETYVEHADLTVAGVACEWWVDDGGIVHASTLEGLARGLAWAADRWEARLLLAAVLAEPDRVEDLLAEAAWD